MTTIQMLIISNYGKIYEIPPVDPMTVVGSSSHYYFSSSQILEQIVITQPNNYKS